jgi:CBS domain-containing protein
MTFIIYGPGIRDPIPTERLSGGRVVEQTQAAAAIRRIPGSEEEKSPGQQAGGGQQRKANIYQQTSEQKVEERAQYAYQIMSSPVYTIKYTATVEELIQLFREKMFRHVPVINEEHKIVGIISDRDVLRFISGIADEEAEQPLTREEKMVQPIESLVKTRVLTASLDTQIRQIARILFEQRVGAMPIVNDLGMLHGLITRSDILKALVKNSALELWV